LSSPCLVSLFGLFFSSRCFAHLYLLSFPTRRSSDLRAEAFEPVQVVLGDRTGRGVVERDELFQLRADLLQPCRDDVRAHQAPLRSEEHTSELQSRENLVCRLLLEKKKNWIRSTPKNG